MNNLETAIKVVFNQNYILEKGKFILITRKIKRQPTSITFITEDDGIDLRQDISDFFEDIPDDKDWTEIEVEVEYNIHGSYRSATLEDPPEYPEIEFIQVLIHRPKSKKSLDISEFLDKAQINCLENSIWDVEEDRSHDHDDSYDDDR